MSEQKGALELLVDAINRNTEALQALIASNGAAPADAKAAGKSTAAKNTGKAKPTEKVGPKHTKAEASEVCVAVKEKLGVDAAKALLGNHGFKKMADITEDKFDAIFEEGTALLEGAGEPEPEDNDDI